MDFLSVINYLYINNVLHLKNPSILPYLFLKKYIYKFYNHLPQKGNFSHFKL